MLKTSLLVEHKSDLAQRERETTNEILKNGDTKMQSKSTGEEDEAQHFQGMGEMLHKMAETL